MSIIGIDPGKPGATGGGGFTGMAVVDAKETRFWSFKVKAGTDLGVALSLFRVELITTIKAGGPGTMVVHEEVINNSRRLPSGLFMKDGGVIPLARLEGVVMEACASSSVARISVNPSKLRAAFRVGKKNGEERTMVDAMREIGYDPLDDHQADALALCEWCLRHTIKT